jgi:hypothetical protein
MMGIPILSTLQTFKGGIMKNFDYKGYFVMLEKQHNGSIRAVADNDSDRFHIAFYDYSMSEIKSRIKTQCAYRIQNNIQEGY